MPLCGTLAPAKSHFTCYPVKDKFVTQGWIVDLSNRCASLACRKDFQLNIRSRLFGPPAIFQHELCVERIIFTCHNQNRTTDFSSQIVLLQSFRQLSKLTPSTIAAS